MSIKVKFETEDCSRCGGSGEYSSCAMYGKTCFKCRGGKIQLTRRGIAARKAFDAVMDRMDKTWAEVKPGDRVHVRGINGALRWFIVDTIEGGSPLRSRTGGESAPWIEIPTLDVTYVNAKFVDGHHAIGTVRVWDAEIYRAAAVRVERLAGATVTGLDE